MAIFHGVTLFSSDGYETWDLQTTDNTLLKKELLYAHNNKPLSEDPANTENEDCILDQDAPGIKQLIEEVSSILDLRGFKLTNIWGHVHPPNASIMLVLPTKVEDWLFK